MTVTLQLVYPVTHLGVVIQIPLWAEELVIP